MSTVKGVQFVCRLVTRSSVCPYSSRVCCRHNTVTELFSKVCSVFACSGFRTRSCTYAKYCYTERVCLSNNVHVHLVYSSAYSLISFALLRYAVTAVYIRILLAEHA
eukprot:3676-Heterococcus_DN1.PRE.2